MLILVNITHLSSISFLLSPLSFYSYTSNTFSYADAQYVYLFPTRFLHHHLYKYHYFRPPVDDICNTLHNLILTIRFFLIHTLVIHCRFTPTHSWLRLLLQLQYHYPLPHLFLLIGLSWLRFDKLFRGSTIHLNIIRLKYSL